MYSYEIQSDRIHRNHPEHSNLENRSFRYVRTLRLPAEEDWKKVLEEMKRTKFLGDIGQDTKMLDASYGDNMYLEFCAWRAGSHEKSRMQLQYCLSSS